MMALLTVVCWNTASGAAPPLDKLSFSQVVQRPLPSIISAAPLQTSYSTGLMAAVANPSTMDATSPSGAMIGELVDNGEAWSIVDAGPLNGSFALCRWNDEVVEAVTDATASRTLWYVKSQSLFVVSSSIKSIIEILGDFRFNEQVIPWVISTGSLGPEGCWDSRIHRVAPDTSLRLDRKRWSISSVPNTKERSSGTASVSELDSALTKALDRDWSRDGYALALSGGYDSRAILLKSRNRTKVRSLTWGSAALLSAKNGDGAVAQALADAVGNTHEFMPIDTLPSLATVIDRFIAASEGRIDHIAGYADGFLAWKQIYDRGITHLVRGDEALGWSPAFTESQTRRGLGLALTSDCFTSDQCKRFGLTDTKLPERMSRQPKETLEAWRDRLYRAWRVPVVLASLNDIKGGYVDVVNPLLDRELIAVASRLPDKLRTEKTAFRRLVHRLRPGIRMASEDARLSVRDIFDREEFYAIVETEMGSKEASSLFNASFLTYVRTQIQKRPSQKTVLSIRGLVNNILPSWLRVAYRAKRSYNVAPIDPIILAFRVIIVVRMIRLLSDAGADVPNSLNLGSGR